jgi:hypothetical protein
LADYPENSMPREFIKLVQDMKNKGELKQELVQDVVRLGLSAILGSKQR